MTTELETSDTRASTNWESEVADLLSMLSTAQGELLDLLAEKRELLMRADTEGLAAIQTREEELVEKLQVCQDRRSKLLDRAGRDGLPSDSIRSLTAALDVSEQKQLKGQIHEAASRARLLQHHSLTNWVLVQRTLLHLSQILEIIATGGRPQPTYGKGGSTQSSGSLMDHAV